MIMIMTMSDDWQSINWAILKLNYHHQQQQQHQHLCWDMLAAFVRRAKRNPGPWSQVKLFQRIKLSFILFFLYYFLVLEHYFPFYSFFLFLGYKIIIKIKCPFDMIIICTTRMASTILKYTLLLLLLFAFQIIKTNAINGTGSSWLEGYCMMVEFI